MPPRGIRKYLPQQEKFAHGYTEAKHVIVAVAIIGEVLQGGLVFGWNALALMLQARNNFAGKCDDASERESGHLDSSCLLLLLAAGFVCNLQRTSASQGICNTVCVVFATLAPSLHHLTTFVALGTEVISNSGRISGCKSQESELAVLWTLGIFALNFGPVLVGPVLDGLGPMWTAVMGEALCRKSVTMSAQATPRTGHPCASNRPCKPMAADQCGPPIPGEHYQSVLACSCAMNLAEFGQVEGTVQDGEPTCICRDDLDAVRELATGSKVYFLSGPSQALRHQT